MKRQGAAFPASIVSRCSVEHTARPPQSRTVHDLYFGNHGGRCARHLFGFCTSAIPGWLCIWPCAHSRSSMECAYYTCPHHRCHWEPDDGIMMRTAKGHTGGPLTVGQLEVLAFLLVQVAAVVRGIRWLVDAIAIHDYGRRFCFLLGGCLCLVRRAVLAPTVAAAVDGKPG